MTASGGCGNGAEGAAADSHAREREMPYNLQDR